MIQWNTDISDSCLFHYSCSFIMDVFLYAHDHVGVFTLYYNYMPLEDFLKGNSMQ